uniref:DUF937 domain-containing protein n=1 Tax=Jeotgalibaca porci TaxID=1868793 RepID=UPI0035A02321
VDNDQAAEKETLAKRADVSKSDFGKVAAVGLPAILQALQRNSADEKGLASLEAALTKHQDVNKYSSVNQVAEQVDPEDGDKILGHVFNDKGSIIDRIARSVGMSPAAVKRVLVLLAPVVLKYLADRKNDKQLDTAGLQKETQAAAKNATKSLENDGRKKRFVRRPFRWSDG